MSKKRQTQQIILSLSAIILLTLVSTLFYLIDDAINDHDVSVSGIKVIEENSSGLSGVVNRNIEETSNNYLKSSDKSSTHYLSEIQDLHDSLQNDIEEKSKATILDKKKVEESEEIVEIEPIEFIRNEDRPKLAIIIDDVAFNYQVKKLRRLNLPLTLSFFPADINHPQTSKYAKEELIPMLHLPLEAQNFHSEEIDTLHVGDSSDKIERRIEQLVRQFPNLRYTNNHTGSRFTSDYTSMKRLLKSLKKHNIQFIDSVTTSKSVVKRVSNELGLRYIRRDIFLDNILDVTKITKQLKKAISIAKERGYAVAIGHPHKATIKALSQIKPLLDGVSLVSIDEI